MNIGWKVEAKNKAHFLKDNWLGGSTLIHRFSRLYSISNCQHKTVGEISVRRETGVEWLLIWRRNRFIWEISHEMQLLELLNGVNMSLDSQDKRIWLGENQGIYTVKSAYACL